MPSMKLFHEAYRKTRQENFIKFYLDLDIEGVTLAQGHETLSQHE